MWGLYVVRNVEETETLGGPLQFGELLPGVHMRAVSNNVSEVVALKFLAARPVVTAARMTF